MLQLGSGCKHDADTRPATYDSLAMATGHWEWESTAYQSGPRTPASVGLLTARRGGQADYTTSCRLSTGPGAYCGGVDASLVTFVSEKDLGNNDVKIYHITQQSGRQMLSLIGEAACVDGGAFETYHWVAE